MTSVPESGRPSTRALRSTLGVALIYGGSIAALLVGEILLARSVGSSAFGEYNLVRQGLPVVVTIALFGYDQALTREVAADGGRPAKLDARQVRLVLLGAVAGIVAGGYLHLRLGVPWLVVAALPLAAVGVALSNLVSGVMRASGHTLLGAATQQGYRLLAGLTFIAAAIWMTAARATMVLAVTTLVVGLAGAYWSSRLHEPHVVTSEKHRLMRHLGVGYSLSLLTLSAGDWLDQSLVRELGGSLQEVGIYSQLKLVTLYPILSIGSVLGFVALPAIAARRHTMTRHLAMGWLIRSSALAVVVALLLAPVSHLVIGWFFGLHPGWGTVSVLSAAGALRLLYVVPSALLGATASPRTLARFGLVGILGLGLQVVLTWAVSGQGLVLAAAVGLLGATLLRVVVSATMAVRDLPTTIPTAVTDNQPNSSLAQE